MPVIRTTTCELCGVDVEILQLTGKHSGEVREHVMSVRGHPKDPNNHHALYCGPDGPSHKEAR